MTMAKNSMDRLIAYCEQESYKGYDPYDGLNSRLFQRLPILPGKRLPRLAWIQLFKRLPLNLRPLVGIRKEYNPKGLALFLAGYCNLARKEGQERHWDKIRFFADKLLELRTPGYSGSCWGYNFPWESKAFYQPRYTPTIVASTFAANALLDAYELTGEERYRTAGQSTRDFIVRDLNRTVAPNGHFAFSYSPHDQTSVFNASLLGARLLARIGADTREQPLLDLARKAVAYCRDYQREDGSWAYSTLPFHQWVDNFHTGFNLECISDYGTYSGDRQFEPCLRKGMDYYLRTFFDAEGRAAYYNNSVYPIDIHAPSQLFVTLYKTGTFAQNQALARRVLGWTIRHMQSPRGYFYYQKRRWLTNRIPYMRWSQAWIFYGLSYYLLAGGDEKET